MEINTRGRYAVMAMADLAKHGAGEPVALSVIAERQQLSLSYLEQIFGDLRRSGLVESARGRSGGYRLARAATEIPVSAIMVAVEEATRMTRCFEAEPGCLGEKRCLTHGLWHALGRQIEVFLSAVSLQDVLDGVPAPAAKPGGTVSGAGRAAATAVAS